MKLTTTLIIGALALGSGMTYAHQPDEEDIYARVIHVEPIYRTYSSLRSVNSCLDYDHSLPVRTSYTGTILGAVIGGALGHKIGDSHGDPGAAAIAGVLLGASFGHSVDRRASYNRHLHVVGPCRSNYRRQTVRELVEYEVTYRYNGKVHQAHMDYDPGEWVKLNVDVSPA